jgi:hypothetical protein
MGDVRLSRRDSTYLLPRGCRAVRPLGQLQDNYHQNDDDQDPDDESDNSSVHFVSLVRVLTRNFRSGR